MILVQSMRVFFFCIYVASSINLSKINIKLIEWTKTNEISLSWLMFVRHSHIDFKVVVFCFFEGVMVWIIAPRTHTQKLRGSNFETISIDLVWIEVYFEQQRHLQSTYYLYIETECTHFFSLIPLNCESISQNSFPIFSRELSFCAENPRVMWNLSNLTHYEWVAHGSASKLVYCNS